jgi:uncharacterized BrkB/YihY/UPF0761 family membrane protein
MKATALKTTLGGSALALALFSGAALFASSASAGAVNNAVYRSDSSGQAPSSYFQEVRRRIFVALASTIPIMTGLPITVRRSPIRRP